MVRSGMICLHHLRALLRRLRITTSERELMDLLFQLHSEFNGNPTWPDLVAYVKSHRETQTDSLIFKLSLALERGQLSDINSPQELDWSETISKDDSYDVSSNRSTRNFKLFDETSTLSLTQDYDSSEWVHMLKSWPSSFVIRKIQAPLIQITAWSFFVALVHSYCKTLSIDPCAVVHLNSIGVSNGLLKVMNLIGSALSLLLVFRTNTAFTRFWEGKKIWEHLCTASRSAIDLAVLYVEEIGTERVRRIADLLCAFPFALQLHLQGKPIARCPQADLQLLFQRFHSFGMSNVDAASHPRLSEKTVPVSRFLKACKDDSDLAGAFGFPSDIGEKNALEMLHCLKFGERRDLNQEMTLDELSAYYNPLALTRILSDRCHLNTRRALLQTRCSPMVIVRALGKEIKDVILDDRFSCRERLAMISEFNKMRSCIGAAERIVQTPVPGHYTRHTIRFLSVWSLVIPLTYVAQLGFLVVPVTAFVVWALFGLREIGHLTENPFRRQLQLQVVTDTINTDVREATDPIIEFSI